MQHVADSSYIGPDRLSRSDEAVPIQSVLNALTSGGANEKQLVPRRDASYWRCCNIAGLVQMYTCIYVYVCVFFFFVVWCRWWWGGVGGVEWGVPRCGVVWCEWREGR